MKNYVKVTNKNNGLVVGFKEFDTLESRDQYINELVREYDNVEVTKDEIVIDNKKYIIL